MCVLCVCVCVGFPRHHRVLHVKQEVRSSEKSVLDTVLQSDVERAALLEEERDILARCAGGLLLVLVYGFLGADGPGCVFIKGRRIPVCGRLSSPDVCACCAVLCGGCPAGSSRRTRPGPAQPVSRPSLPPAHVWPPWVTYFIA